MKIFAAISFFITSLLLMPSTPALAAGDQIKVEPRPECQVIYGGGVVCPEVPIIIDKKVQAPTKGGQFVDNLLINDPKFAPNENVIFQIEVKNTGSQTIPRIESIDTLPNFLTFVSGVGTFDNNKKTLTFVINNLEPGKSQLFTVVTKATDENTLPQPVNCNVENRITATTDKRLTATDMASVCIEKKVLAAVPKVAEAPIMEVTPPTGPEILPLLGLFPTGLLGYFLRKNSKAKA